MSNQTPSHTKSTLDFGDPLDQQCGKSKPKFVVNQGQRFDYRVRVVSEGALGTLVLGRSKINPAKLANTLNEMSAQGYRNMFQVLERRRMLIFWTRESLVLNFERSLV